MLEERKPFYLKNKLLYQTKINIWGVNQELLSARLKKKKWNFLRFANRQDKKLPTFKFSPFSRNFVRRFNRYNFKNNLYLRKLVRFKYGRLKNKELYALFRKTNNYKDFINLLGTRLDIFLYRIFKKNKSIFNLRQLLIHKGVSINGRAVKSPNFRLKKFDIISLNIKDFSEYYFLYQTPYELAYYVLYMFFYTSKHVNFETLNKEGRLLFLQDFCKLVCSKHYDASFVFVEKESKKYLQDIDNQRIRNNIIFDDTFSKKMSLESFISILKERFLVNQILTENFFIEKGFILDSFLNSKDDKNFLGFFNENRLGLENFEFNFYKGRLDIVFLGVSERDKDILSNDKYLLHYLY
jgi:ribosomal protein S4